MNTALPGLVVDIEARIDKLEKGLAKANRAQRRSAQSMERRANQSAERIRKSYGKATGGIAAGFKKLALPLVGGLATAGTIRALSQVTKGVAQIGDEAKRAGVPLKDFQEWKFVAEQNRIGVDALTDGFKELNLRADEFIITGKGSAAEAFARLGYGAEDLREKLKNPSDLLLEIMKRMRRLNSAARIRVADELFGGSAGERFVELVDQGEEGLRRTIDRAHELGVVLDDDVVQRADEISRKFDEITGRISSFGKRVAVAVAEGVVEIADMRARLDELFPSEAVGRSVVGDELYDALEQNREAVDAEAGNLARLNQLHTELGETATRTAASLTSASNLVRSYGYDDAAIEISGAATEMLTLADEFANGSIEAGQFAERLEEIRGGAAKAFDQMSDADRVDFGNAISEVSRLGNVLSNVISLADTLGAAISDAAGMQSAKTPMQVFREADAASMQSYETQKAALSKFLSAEAERNSMSRERLNLERQIELVIKRAAATGVTLSKAQATAAAKAALAGSEARRESSKSGAGGSTNEFTRAVASIKDEIAGLELEAAALISTAAAGKNYAEAVDVARQEAELLLAAQQAGIAVTPRLRAEIRNLARDYSGAANAVSEAEEAQERFQAAKDQVRDTAGDAFTGLITGANSLSDALGMVLGKLAEVATNKAFDVLWNGSGADGMLSGIFTALGFSGGGYTGDGGKYEPAGVVHRGEYVMSKAATQRIGVGNLEALHSGAVRGYAAGGYVGAATTIRSTSEGRSSAAAAGPPPVTINAPVTVQGSAGTPDQNQDLAKQVAREMEGVMRGVVVDELRRQSRPGNMLSRGR
jgi:hypothetical protein